jgi:hypothetical protein
MAPLLGRTGHKLSDLSSKKISPDGFSTCKQYLLPLVILTISFGEPDEADGGPAHRNTYVCPGPLVFFGSQKEPLWLSKELVKN